MKKVSYNTKCKNCGHLETFIMRSDNANPGISDKTCHDIATKYMEKPFRLLFCENCKLSTVQEIVAFDLP